VAAANIAPTNGCWQLMRPIAASIVYVTGAILCLTMGYRAYGGVSHDLQAAMCSQIRRKIQKGEIDAAIDEAQQAVKEYPLSSSLNQLLGTALYAKGLKTQAATAFRKAIELNPQVAANYFDLGLIELSLHDSKAIHNLEVFVRLEPDSAPGQLLLGHAYQYVNLTLPAIKQYEKAIELSPRLPLSHYHLALAYQSQGELDSALAQFKKEIEINPTFPDSYRLAGNIEMDHQDFDAAETLFQECVCLKPDDFRAHYGLARAFLAKGQLKKAESELGKCVKMKPSSIRAHYTLAQTYQRLGRKEDAEREYKITTRLHWERHAELSTGIARHRP
jgi:tetratricopeptide (TPR) repeat protein